MVKLFKKKKKKNNSEEETLHNDQPLQANSSPLQPMQDHGAPIQELPKVKEEPKVAVAQESEAHKVVAGMRGLIDQFYQDNQNQLTSDAIHPNREDPNRIPTEFLRALADFKTDLGKLLENDNNNPDRMNPKAQKDLIENTVSLVENCKSKLEVAPGFWNQLKASINDIAEKYLNTKDLLGPVEKTKFSSEKFHSFKQQLKDIQRQPEQANEAENTNTMSGPR